MNKPKPPGTTPPSRARKPAAPRPASGKKPGSTATDRTRRKPAPKQPAAPRSKAAGKAAAGKAASGKPAAGNDAARRIADRVVAALDNLKAKNVVTIDVRPLTQVMDILVIASGTSNRHVKALAENAIVELKKSGEKVYGSEGMDAGEWVLVDFGGVILHVMQPHIREFYDLERLWTAPAPPPAPAG